MRLRHTISAGFFSLVLSACAPMVVSSPVTLAPVATADAIQLTTRVTFKLPTGYQRELPAGSRWQAAGRLSEGVVYRPLNTVFAIEGRQVHEAHLVIDKARLVGFYLPAEGRYSSLDVPLELPLKVLP